MSFCQDKKITCQFINLKEEDILNNLEQITFNNDSTIVLTIQNSYIQAYLFKNEDLKIISSFKVQKDPYFSQIQYLAFSNSYLAIPKSQILISTLIGLNAKKFLLKVQHGLGSCNKLLINKDETNLFICNYNEIQIFQKQIIGWKCIDTLQSLSGRDTIDQLCLSLEEDNLIIHTRNGYSGSPTILIYRRKLIDKEILWDLKQIIRSEKGELWGFINNHQFLFFDYFRLNIYTQNQQNQKFESTNFIDLKQPNNFQFQSYAMLHNQILLIITQSDINIMELYGEQKLRLKQLINIDLSKLIESNPGSRQFRSILTKDGQYLFIWIKKKTQIIKIRNIHI